MTMISHTEATPKLTLRQIVDAMLDAIDAADGEVTPAVDALDLALADKVEAYGAVIAQLQAEDKALTELATEYLARRDARQRQVTSLKFRLEQALRDAGVDKLKTKTCSVWFQETTSVQLENEAMFLESAPDRFVTVKTYVNKTAIREALEAGEQVEGAAIVARRGLRIR
jgi:phage host-nuclease inhibitor protein Gam